jgi:hypothetical protein
MTQPALIQDVSAGRTPATKYGGFGVSGYRGIPRPTNLFGLAVGMSGSGKSTFFQTCPDAAIINIDGSPTVTSNPLAAIWPIRGEDGNLYESDLTTKVHLDWEAVRAKRDLLIRLAEADEPRPAMVVMDTINLAIPLVREHICRYAHSKYNIADEDSRLWRQMDGRPAWDELYNEIISFTLSLRRAGYGFWWTMHLTQQYIKIGEDISKDVITVNVTDNFWSRLFPLFDMVCAVEQTETTETITDQVAMPGGRTMPKTRIVRKPIRILTVDPGENPKLAGIIKSRVKLPGTIRLSESDAWADFERAYTQVATP